MKIFAAMAEHGHEQLVFCHDRKTGLRAVIGIHDTTLGPALGGCRMWPYATEDEAVADALRLSLGMTYKSAVAGQDFGGGKCVIWGDPGRDKSEGLFRSLGQFVQSLGGRFITGPDVGTRPDDFAWSASETRWVVALPEGYGSSGDTGPITAFGLWRAMKAVMKELEGDDRLAGRTVAIQGVGKVGARLASYLVEDGARVVVADVDASAVERLRQQLPAVEVTTPDAIYEVPCDIFAPCALGGVLNDETIGRLRCRAVCGGANNQLASPAHGDELHARGILYAPDFVVNAGGLIQVANELGGYDRDRAFRTAARIYDWCLEVFALARDGGIPTYQAANRVAERRIAALGAIHRTTLPDPGRRKAPDQGEWHRAHL